MLFLYTWTNLYMEERLGIFGAVDSTFHLFRDYLVVMVTVGKFPLKKEVTGFEMMK